MGSSNPANLLGIGLYTPSEAAFYARVPTQTLNRWLYGNSMGEALLEPQMASSDERFVTFRDFIQALYLRHLRTEYHISLPKIRKGIQVACEKYGVAHPLAMEKVMYLYGSELIIRLKEDIGQGDSFVQVTGKETHHRMLKQIVELYMKDIHFDQEAVWPMMPDVAKAVRGTRFKLQMRPDGCGFTIFDADRKKPVANGGEQTR